MKTSVQLARRVSPFMLVLALLNANGGISYKDSNRELFIWREVPAGTSASSGSH